MLRLGQGIRVVIAALALLSGLAGLGASPAQGEDDATRLIPRRIFFGNPDRSVARISPDGKNLAFIAPVKGVLNVWVGPISAPDQARPITTDKKRGVTRYFWAFDNRHILYMQDADGDENWHVYAVDLQGGKTKDLTPLPKVAAQIEGVSHKFPGEILVGLNDRNPQFHDIHRVNIATGERKLVEQNDRFASFVCDDDYRVRFAMRYTPDGGTEYLRADGDKGWVNFLRIPMEDSGTTNLAGFDKTEQRVYLIDSRGRDTGALKLLDLETGDEQLLAANDKADIRDVILHPTEKTVQAVIFNYLRSEWQTFDKQVGADIEHLKTIARGEIELADRTLDDKQWIVAFLEDDGPTQYYHFDRASRKATFLFVNRAALKGLPLVHMQPMVVKSRDGLDLVCYLSLPRSVDPDQDGKPDRPVPLVLNVHGGPWARDSWGYDPECQLLANRGYGVLQVNFRGSSGFGKSFLNAGNREWAAKMHDDLLDAVDWAVKEKIADPKKIAIMGGSYGGYATLVGLTFTPDVFACGVDIVGPSNILTLLSTIPPYWEPAKQMFRDRVGDFASEEGRTFLLSRSPLSFVEKIKRPLLIGQGAQDPRVKQAEADQIVKAMTDKKIPVTYALYPDEGHGFVRPENRMSFYAVTEAFLAEHLGGRAEPIGDAFAGSSLEVPAGADQIKGLAAALKLRGEELPGQGAEDVKPAAGGATPAGKKPAATTKPAAGKKPAVGAKPAGVKPASGS